MLMSQQEQSEEIPYKPFPEGEATYWYLNDDTVRAIFGNDGTADTEMTFSPLIGNKLNSTTNMLYIPKNHCTVIFGVSNKEYEEFVVEDTEKTCEGRLIINNTRMSDGSIGSTTIISHTAKFGTDAWEESTKEVRVQLDFEDSSKEMILDLFSKPTYSRGNQGITIEGMPVTAYMNCYLKVSNEIHEMGPEIVNGKPLIVKIASFS
jgi:hypothetical protein